MIPTKWNNIRVGLIMGLLAPIVGYFIVAFVMAQFLHTTVWGFTETKLINAPTHRSELAVLSLMANGIVFFILNYKNHLVSMRGMIYATLFYAPIVVLLYFMK